VKKLNWEKHIWHASLIQSFFQRGSPLKTTFFELRYAFKDSALASLAVHQARHADAKFRLSLKINLMFWCWTSLRELSESSRKIQLPFEVRVHSTAVELFKSALALRPSKRTCAPTNKNDSLSGILQRLMQCYWTAQLKEWGGEWMKCTRRSTSHKMTENEACTTTTTTTLLTTAAE
jgi:hypothetical protein